jgi:hypothetical protein
LHHSDVCEVGALYFRVRKYILFEQFDVHGLDMQALIAEGRFYSDMELTEQEIERMVQNFWQEKVFVFNLLGRKRHPHQRVQSPLLLGPVRILHFHFDMTSFSKGISAVRPHARIFVMLSSD